MNVLIVEDETSAYENLHAICREVDSQICVVGNTESVARTIEWLRTKPLPDLIFMDIHLSDGSAFSIFDRMEIDVPIVFTTAYDKYALEAFRVNSIDYLLKPIKSSEVERAIRKYRRFGISDGDSYRRRIAGAVQTLSHDDRFLIPHRDKLLPVRTDSIAFIYTSGKVTTLYTKEGIGYPFSSTLEQVMARLDPLRFYRANKQFVINRDRVRDITVWFDSRLMLTLDVEVPERIYVSKNRAAEFKTWIVNKI